MTVCSSFHDIILSVVERRRPDINGLMNTVMENSKKISHIFAAAMIVLIAAVTALVMMPQQAFAEESKAENEAEKQPAATTDIYVKTLRTNSKAAIGWNKVKNADGYIVYQKDDGEWDKVSVTSSTSVTRTDLDQSNSFKVIAYTKENGKTVKGDAFTKEVLMPKIIKPSTRGYKDTYGYKVIKKAKTKYGARYIWGASGPTVFDCSGFTYWTYKKCGVSGIKFNRMNSRSIYRNFKRHNLGRKLSKAQTGDILLFSRSGSTKSIYHVGMYDKNGYYVHANGKKVTRSKVPTRQLVAIIRMPGLQ